MIMKKGTVNQCVITLTHDCNLRCKFCYAKGTQYVKNDYLDYDVLIRIIDFCNEFEINDIVFSGGEPTLYPYLIDALKYISSQKRVMSVSMSSNGIKLEDYDFCKEIVMNGIQYIDISLKAKDEKECINIAGKKGVEEQLKAIENLSKLPVTLTCSMVLTSDNIDGFIEAVKSARTLGAKQFSFSLALDNELASKKDKEYLIDNNPFLLVDKFVSQIQLLDEITEGEWWVEYTYPLCVYSKEQLNALQGRLAEPCQIFNGLGITFDTNGYMIPCSMYFENYIGQFNKDFHSVNEFQNFTDSETYRSTIDELNKLPSSECLDCELLEMCRGGCPIFWKNYSFESFKELKNIYEKRNH